MRKTLTIPAAGETKRYSLTGNSVIVESASTYDTVEDVPLMAFDSGDSQRPVYPRSTYLADQGRFNSLLLTGTTASAGDEITVLSLEECLDSEIIIQFSDSFQSRLKATFTKAASNSVQSLSEVELVNADGLLPSAINITVRGGATSGINYAYDADPSQGLSATDSYYFDGDPENTPHSRPQLRIEGINYILAFRFIAAVLDETPNLIITCEY